MLIDRTLHHTNANSFMYLYMKTMKWVTMNFAALFYEQLEAGGVCETESMSLAKLKKKITPLLAPKYFINLHTYLAGKIHDHIL